MKAVAETLPPGLYVVATPLGNLGDLSERAAMCLRMADRVFAEDTRRTQALLMHLGAKKNLQSLHAHNELQRQEAVLRALDDGQAVVLVSDAGTPAVSDPGALVVGAAHVAGHLVVPVSGPSALSTALSASGFVAGEAGALFLGFLPTKGKARRLAVQRALGHVGIVVIFESPHRIAATLEEFGAACPDRLGCVCRELTKLHEEIIRAPVRELEAWAKQGRVLGEITLVLGPAGALCEDGKDSGSDEGRVDALLKRCLSAGLSARDAASAVAAMLELPRRRVYGRCFALDSERSSKPESAACERD